MAAAILCLLLILSANVAHGCLGQCVCGELSTFELRIGVSPCNNAVSSTYKYKYDAILWKDVAGGQPLGNFDNVWLDFSACGGPDHVDPDGPSDPNGNISWSVNLDFGGSDPCEVYVVDGCSEVVVYTIEGYDGSPGNPNGGLRSPDYNGDGLVAVDDLSRFQTAYNANPQQPSYEGDMNVDNGNSFNIFDLSWFQAHYSACNP